MGRMIDFGHLFYHCLQLVNLNGHICGSDKKVVYLSFDEAPEYERCVSHFNVVRVCGVHGVTWQLGKSKERDQRQRRARRILTDPAPKKGWTKS